MTKHAELAHLFRALKAPAAARALPALADRAREESWSYEHFAEVLLGTEVSSRDSWAAHQVIAIPSATLALGLNSKRTGLRPTFPVTMAASSRTRPSSSRCSMRRPMPPR